jgi:hypothetical protein
MTHEPDYKQACIEQEHEISQLLGEVLYGYGPEGLPRWGDHVAVTLAMVAARRLRELSLALKEIAEVGWPALVAQGIAYQAMQGCPTADDTIRDARRYRALRNHSQMMDPRMDGTALYRVRGIPGRFNSFEAAVDSLVKQEDEHAHRPRPWLDDATQCRVEEAAAIRANDQAGDVHPVDADRGPELRVPRPEDRPERPLTGQ